MEDNSAKGLIQIYTGDGKGKSTAALGLAIRAVGQGLRVGFFQFLKGETSGEHMFLKRYPAFEIKQLGRGSHFTRDHTELASEAQETLLNIEKEMQNFDMLILDEVFIAVEQKLITARQLRDLLKNKPEALEIVLTGRYAPREIVRLADLVTEMTMIKHPYQQGIRARRGIEY